jgi:hypothetical protein
MTVGERGRQHADSGSLPGAPGWGGSRRSAWGFYVGAVILAGCGGGTSPVASGTPVSGPPLPFQYADSVVVGTLAQQSITYTSATSTTLAYVTAVNQSPLLGVGNTSIIGEHVDSALPGLREVCVSGDGQSVNVIDNINLGVNAKSAALLLDQTWSAADSSDAWAAAVSAGTKLSGWENCGVKAEGLPSQSSLLSPLGDGSYSEDVYDGNPGTTFNTITQTVSASQVNAMLAPGGYASGADPTRPLQLYLRAFKSTAGALIFVEIGIASEPGEDPGKGFIEFYAGVQ